MKILQWEPLRLVHVVGWTVGPCHVLCLKKLISEHVLRMTPSSSHSIMAKLDVLRCSAPVITRIHCNLYHIIRAQNHSKRLPI